MPELIPRSRRRRRGGRGDDVETAAVTPIEVPGGGRIRVGTASWTDPTMTASGVFYPTRRPRPRSGSSITRRRSRWSRSMRRTTRSRGQATAKLWVERTPPDFIFDIKAHALMTGQGTETSASRRRSAANSPSRSPRSPGSTPRTCHPTCSTRSGPRSGTPSSRSPKRVNSARSCSSTPLVLPVVGEPRDDRGGRRAAERDPLRRRVPQCLVAQREERRPDAAIPRDHGIAFVMVDEPQGFKSSVPPVTAVTSDLALVRFHGRNRDTWEAKGITPAERFRYLYRATSWRSGRRRSDRSPARRRTRTSS